MRKLLATTLCALVLSACETGETRLVQRNPSINMMNIKNKLDLDIYSQTYNAEVKRIPILDSEYTPNHYNYEIGCANVALKEITVKIDGSDIKLNKNQTTYGGDEFCSSDEFKKRMYAGSLGVSDLGLSLGKHKLTIDVTDESGMSSSTEMGLIFTGKELIPQYQEVHYLEPRFPTYKYKTIVNDTTTPVLQLQFTPPTSAIAEIRDEESYICQVNVQSEGTTKTYTPPNAETTFIVNIPDTRIQTTITATNCAGQGGIPFTFNSEN